MKIYQVQNNTSFKSQFAADRALDRTFYIARRSKDERYLLALKKLIYNGRDEIISFKPDMINNKIYKGMTLMVNDEPRLNVSTRFGITSGIDISKTCDIMKLITEYARLSKAENRANIKDFNVMTNKLQSIVQKKNKQSKKI